MLFGKRFVIQCHCGRDKVKDIFYPQRFECNMQDILNGCQAIFNPVRLVIRGLQNYYPEKYRSLAKPGLYVPASAQKERHNIPLHSTCDKLCDPPPKPSISLDRGRHVHICAREREAGQNTSVTISTI